MMERAKALRDKTDSLFELENSLKNSRANLDFRSSELDKREFQLRRREAKLEERERAAADQPPASEQLRPAEPVLARPENLDRIAVVPREPDSAEALCDGLEQRVQLGPGRFPAMRSVGWRDGPPCRLPRPHHAHDNRGLEIGVLRCPTVPLGRRRN
jgi:hypothetical protein